MVIINWEFLAVWLQTKSVLVSPYHSSTSKRGEYRNRYRTWKTSRKVLTSPGTSLTRKQTIVLNHWMHHSWGEFYRKIKLIRESISHKVKTWFTDCKMRGWRPSLPEWWAGLEARGRWRPQWRLWRCWPRRAPWSAAPRWRCSSSSSRCRLLGTETRTIWAWSRCSRWPRPCWRCWWASSPPREGSLAGPSRGESRNEGPSLSWSENRKLTVRSVRAVLWIVKLSSLFTCYINQSGIDYQVTVDLFYRIFWFLRLLEWKIDKRRNLMSSW